MTGTLPAMLPAVLPSVLPSVLPAVLPAAMLAAAAAALLCPSVPPRPVGADPARAWRRRRRSVLPVAGLGAGATVLVATLDGTALGLALIGLGAAAGAGRLAAAGRERRRRESRRASVVEVGETLVGELRAGQPVLPSLERGAETWPELTPVVAAARLGADVPLALRRLADLPGAGGLRMFAAAWQVSERSGATLSDALTQVVESARAQAVAEHLVRAELASAQATARLVAALPLATLAMAAGAGGDPWSFLLQEPAGLACLGLGVGLVLAGLWWFDRIALAVTRS